MKRAPVSASLFTAATCCVAHYAFKDPQRPIAPLLAHNDATGCIRVSENTPSRILRE